MAEDAQKKSSAMIPVTSGTQDIKSLIYIVRGQQVMLDSDLAELYQIETKVFNQAVSRNIERFPEIFRFQLTKEEYDSLRSQFVISNGRGGRKYKPYVFTEQGIAMLSSVLRSDVAIQVSIKIMNTFVEMRHFISNNSLLFEKISHVELKQLEYQKNTDERFAKVFRYIEDHAEAAQKIFFDGQIYDAFSLITSIIQKARNEIILIDGYVDVSTLNLLAKKNEGVSVLIYTFANSLLTDRDIATFNEQYPLLTVKRTSVFHDRFIILDKRTTYHIGASIKDAGKKCFGISRMEDPSIVNSLLTRLQTI